MLEKAMPTAGNKEPLSLPFLTDKMIQTIDHAIELRQQIINTKSEILCKEPTPINDLKDDSTNHLTRLESGLNNLNTLLCDMQDDMSDIKIFLIGRL